MSNLIIKIAAMPTARGLVSGDSSTGGRAEPR
jgi:hypothetical protein